jgi:hypothetical protein
LFSKFVVLQVSIPGTKYNTKKIFGSWYKSTIPIWPLHKTSTSIICLYRGLIITTCTEVNRQQNYWLLTVNIMLIVNDEFLCVHYRSAQNWSFYRKNKLSTKGETIHRMYRNRDYFGDGSVHDTWRPLMIQTIWCSFF